MTAENHKTLIEDILRQHPIFEYAFLDIDDVAFSDKARFICETECTNYGHSWACPPHIGDFNECMATCKQFKHACMFSTITEADTTFFDQCLDERRDHEALSREIHQQFSETFDRVLMFTSGCVLCDECACPDAPCRHPEKRFSTAESHGIIIMKTAADAGMTYDFGNNMITYFSIIFYE